MTTRYRPMRMRLNKVEKLMWQKVWSSIDIDADMNELESSGEENPISLTYNGGSLLTASNHASYLYDAMLTEDYGKGTFEITYDFSTAIRRNKFENPRTRNIVSYGSGGWSFRTLYEYLSTTYGGGTYFIDTFFDRYFTSSPAFQVYQDLIQEVNLGVQEDIEAMRRTGPEGLQGRAVLKKFVEEQTGRQLRDASGRFASVASPDARVEQDIRSALSDGGWAKLLAPRRKQIEFKMKELSDRIRESIIECLRAGDLTRRAAKGTIENRWRLRLLDSSSLFYASGQLVKDMKIYVQLDSGGWNPGEKAPQMRRGVYQGNRVVGGRL